MNRPVALAGMAAILCAMGWLNYRWMERPVSLSPIVSQAGAPALNPDNTLVESGGNTPELRITETLLRPLFHASRRPFVPPPPVEVAAPVVNDEVALLPAAEQPPAVQPETRPDVKLSGISISGGTKRALLRLAENPDVRWYSEGDTLEGWIVASITNQAVTMARNEKTFVVPLYPASGGGGQ